MHETSLQYNLKGFDKITEHAVRYDISEGLKFVSLRLMTDTKTRHIISFRLGNSTDQEINRCMCTLDF